MEEKTRLEKRYDELEELGDYFLSYPPSIYDICLGLKMSVDGSADPLDAIAEKCYVNFLKTTLLTWEVNKWQDSKWGVLQNSFDNCMEQLIMITLSIYYERKCK
jgi:hypothetical protein